MVPLAAWLNEGQVGRGWKNNELVAQWTREGRWSCDDRALRVPMMSKKVQMVALKWATGCGKILERGDGHRDHGWYCPFFGSGRVKTLQKVILYSNGSVKAFPGKVKGRPSI